MHLASQPAFGRFQRIVGCLLVSSLVVGGSGCGSAFIKSLREVGHLRSQLIAEFHEDDIQVSLGNSTQLSVTFVNSVLNERPSEERAKRAQDTALFIKSHYAGVQRLQRIWIFFATYKTRYVVVHYTKSVDMFLFDRNGARIEQGYGYDSDPPPETHRDDEARAIYRRSRNQTDVQIVRLQLAGNMDEGMALVPGFTVPGDATSPQRRSNPPATINFTFASYAPKKIFVTDVPFAMTADGRQIYESTTLNTSKTTEGGNEFLVQDIPFAQFLQLTRARKAKLKLANREYPLTEKQLAALREMVSYVDATQP